MECGRGLLEQDLFFADHSTPNPAAAMFAHCENRKRDMIHRVVGRVFRARGVFGQSTLFCFTQRHRCAVSLTLPCSKSKEQHSTCSETNNKVYKTRKYWRFQISLLKNVTEITCILRIFPHCRFSESAEWYNRNCKKTKTSCLNGCHFVWFIWFTGNIMKISFCYA